MKPRCRVYGSTCTSSQPATTINNFKSVTILQSFWCSSIREHPVAYIWYTSANVNISSYKWLMSIHMGLIKCVVQLQKHHNFKHAVMYRYTWFDTYVHEFGDDEYSCVLMCCVMFCIVLLSTLIVCIRRRNLDGMWDICCVSENMRRRVREIEILFR